MQRVDREPAYVLHGRPYRETSLLIEVFTRDHGRLGLVARGARSPRSSWKNLLQPFRPLLLSWNMGGELGTLTAADQVAAPPAASGTSLFCGFYVNELLMRGLQRSDAHCELFEAYRVVLAGLSSDAVPEPGLRVFEKHLLDALGFGLQLEHECDTGAAVVASAWYAWVPERGMIRREQQAAGDAAAFDARLVSGASLLALQSNQVEAAHARELKHLMRRVLAHYLGDKPLMSQQLFQRTENERS